jgi:hypothetical protein
MIEPDDEPITDVEAVDPLTLVERDSRFRLPPLGKLMTGPPRNVYDVCRRYVWITGTERFLDRLAPWDSGWNTRQFNSEFNSYASRRESSLASELFGMSNTPLRKFKRIKFIPGRGEFDGDDYNTWRPSPVIPIKGDTELWDSHLLWLFADDETRNLVLDWMAWTYQNLTAKPGVALVIVGETTGTGKSMIVRLFEHIMGKQNSQRPKNSSLTGDFNAWAANCKLMIIEELYQAGRKDTLNRMQEIITEPRFEVNLKHINAYKVDSYLAGIATTNHPDALPIDEGDRRYVIAETTITPAERDAAKADGMFGLMDVLNAADEGDPEAFKVIGAIAYQLKTRDVRHFKRGDATMTGAKAAMIGLGRSPLDRWLNEQRENYPFTRTIINVREDIIARIPDDVMRDNATRNVESLVMKWLKRHLDGVAIDSHRVKLHPQGKTTVVSLWALNDLGVEVKSRIAKGASGRAALGNLDVPAVYLAERALADVDVESPATAADDFDESPEPWTQPDFDDGKAAKPEADPEDTLMKDLGLE